VSRSVILNILQILLSNAYVNGQTPTELKYRTEQLRFFPIDV
jgi:hypothetical protein